MTLTYSDIKEGDVIETYELVEGARLDERNEEDQRASVERDIHGRSRTPNVWPKRISTIVAHVSRSEYESEIPQLAGDDHRYQGDR